MIAIKKLIKDDIRLPSPPAIAIRILEAVKKDSNYDELSQIIMSDPSLAVKTLKVATKSDLLDAADSALYESKRNGRNKISMAKVSVGD